MKRYSTSREIDQLVKRLLADGWRYQAGRRHGRVRPPSGCGFVSVPGTPSDFRAYLNFSHAIRRLHRSRLGNFS